MRYLKTSLPKSSMMIFDNLTFLRNGNLAGSMGTGLCDTLGSTSAITWKLLNDKDSSWLQLVAMASRSSVVTMVLVEHSTSSREILLPQAVRKSIKPDRD